MIFFVKRERGKKEKKGKYRGKGKAREMNEERRKCWGEGERGEKKMEWGGVVKGARDIE